MQMQSRFLSETEKARIHRDSLRILSELGIRFRSARARSLLTRQGAKVEADGDIVRIPAEMVEQALKTAPRSFTLGARQAAFDFALPSAFTGYTLDGAATFAVDFETGERRYAVTQDLIASLRLFEEWRKESSAVRTSLECSGMSLRTTFGQTTVPSGSSSNNRRLVMRSWVTA